MTSLDRITHIPSIAHGRPTIRGMRVRVSDVLGLLASGVTADEILDDYPYLEPEDITACLEYAAGEADHPVVLAS